MWKSTNIRPARLGAMIDVVVEDAKHALPLLLKALFQPLARLVR
jgi:hypothetical protein